VPSLYPATSVAFGCLHRASAALVRRNLYTCPAGKALTTTGRLVNDGETLLYRASMRHCRSCPLKAHLLSKGAFPQGAA
jgi:hypothetical protein